MLLDVVKVVPRQQGEALLLVEGQVVAGDEVETPAAELVGVVQLTGQQERYKEGRSET